MYCVIFYSLNEQSTVSAVQNGMKTCFLILTLGISNSFFAQDLEEAVRHYYLDEHFRYDPNLIRQEQIASIDKTEFHYRYDSIYYQIYNPVQQELAAAIEERFRQEPDSSERGLLLERHLFREDGRPLRIEHMKTWRSDSMLIEFRYDSLNNLVQKTVWQPSKNPPYKMRENEVFQWEYQGKKLVGFYRYLTPNESPDRLMLFTCDSVAYDTANASVTLFTNHERHRKKTDTYFHRDSFVRPVQTKLTFYPNYKPKSSIVEYTSRIDKKQFDSCGYSNPKLPDLIAGQTGFRTCFSPDLPWLHSTFNKVVKSDSLTEIYLAETGIWDKSGFFPQLDSNNVIRIYPKEQRLTVQTVGEWMSIKQAGNEHHYTREVKHYDFQMRLLMTERFRADHMQGEYSQRYLTEPVDIANPPQKTNFERYERECYEYYDNGLLKSMTSVAAHYKTFSKSVFRLNYF